MVKTAGFYLIAGLITLALPALMLPSLAQCQSLPGGGGFPGGGGVSLEDYKEDTAADIVNKAKSEAASRRNDVKSDIKSWDGTGEKWENYRGSDDVEGAQDEDSDVITGDGFEECQGEESGHDKVTYDDMMFPGITLGYPPMDLMADLQPECEVNWTRYMGFMGDMTSPFGYCATRHFECPVIGCCGWYADIWDIVDYWYPTAKIDVSEEPFQSMYLSKDEVDTYVEENWEKFVKTKAADQAVHTLAETAMTVGGSVDEAKGKKFAKDAIKALDNLKGENEDLVFTAPHSKHAFARILSEPVNMETMYYFWIPHVPKEPNFGNDFLEGYEQRLTLDKQRDEPLDYRYDSFFDGNAPGEVGLQFACVGQDMLTGKTPDDLLGSKSGDAQDAADADGDNLLGLGGFGGGGMCAMMGGGMEPSPGTPADVPSKNLCLKDVGERFTLASAGRHHITDRAFQGAAKVLDGYIANDGGCYPQGQGQAMHYMASRHSYKETKDKWYVLRNKDFKDEMEGMGKQCKTLPEMLTKNVEFAKSNIKEEKKGGERTFELFTHFRGCWGMGNKGVDESSKNWWKICEMEDGYKCRVH